MTIDQVCAVLTVPAGVDARRREIAEAVVNALDIVQGFADQHGWSPYAREPYFCTVEIYSTSEELWRRILALDEVVDLPPPTDAVTAALEKEVLLAVLPEEAKRLRSEYFRDPHDWTRALAHEIVHRLHVRILNSDETAMGPEWFFEGLAVIGSGQPLGTEIQVADAEHALRLVEAPGRGAYARYAAALRFFLTRISVPELVAQAGRDDFAAWLREKSKV